jgi:putative hydrolase of the HAD superfamily
MSAYRAVLFDFFGTLTHAVSRGPAHAHIARWLGCDPGAFTEALDRTFLDRARGGYGTASQSLRLVAESVGVRPSRAQLAAALPARLAAVRMDTRLRPDAVPVLRRLQDRGVRTDLPVAPLLDTCVYSIEVGVCKPDPRMYLTACARLGVEPDECLYVGDGGSQELSGAEAVGMTPVRLTAWDLRGHLRFNEERRWAGRSARSLTDAVGYLDPSPAGRPVGR